MANLFQTPEAPASGSAARPIVRRSCLRISDLRRARPEFRTSSSQITTLSFRGRPDQGRPRNLRFVLASTLTMQRHRKEKGRENPRPFVISQF
jgi:hypothetical protein